ncbi:MAG: M56 family metallopeptidase [Peptostreptococcaceae bacterium]|nr:M56 family metallopeptidase [Peptostreptococcaceae bacterium]
MTVSLILSNCLFLGAAILLLAPHFHAVRFLTWKKGLPFLLLSGFVIVKSFFPWELPFTKTLPSRTILPFLYQIPEAQLWKGVSLINLTLLGWVLASSFLIARIVLQYRKIRSILNCVSETEDEELLRMVKQCNKRKTAPKVIEIDAGIGPFLLGWKDPILAIPPNLSKEERRFSLLHEMMHHNHSHMLIKLGTELLFAVYFWNPIIRIFRKLLLQAVELQTDSYVKEYLSEEECCQYAEILLQNVRRMQNPVHPAVCLSFFPKENILKKRVLCILSEEKESLKERFARGIGLALSLLCLISSMFLTIEVSYPIPPEILEEGMIITEETSYFQKTAKNQYEFYIEGHLIGVLDLIPKEHSNLPVK